MKTVYSLDELNKVVGNKEDGLGNPTSDGQILTSTVAGVRSWVDPALINKLISLENRIIELESKLVHIEI